MNQLRERIISHWKSSAVGIGILCLSAYLLVKKVTKIPETTPLIVMGLAGLGVKDDILGTQKKEEKK
jgi:hypothetical protein